MVKDLLRRMEPAMRQTITIACLVTLAAVPAFAGSTRTLNESLPAEDLTQVSLDIGAGEIGIGVHDEETVVVEVLLRPRRGGLFSSLRKAEREVESARLSAETVGHELVLKVRSSTDDRRFEEDWSILLPRRLAVAIDAGVGDITIRDVAGGISIDAGVGDILIAVPSGDISIDAGVGDATVKAPAASYGHVKCSAGVGDADIKVKGERIESEGFVGHQAVWFGDGPSSIGLEAGVGDLKVILG
jgi:hypothetical protein